jgi:hypothetical protein
MNTVTVTCLEKSRLTFYHIRLLSVKTVRPVQCSPDVSKNIPSFESYRTYPIFPSKQTSIKVKMSLRF